MIRIRNELRFQGDLRIVGKRAERVDCGMDGNAGKQASAAIENRHKQEADRNRKADLAKVVCQVHSAAVKQIDQVSDAEGYARDENCRFYVIFRDRGKQEPSEDYFLQEADAKHARNAANRFRRRIIDGNPVPKVSRRKENKRRVIKEPTGRDGRFAKPVSLLQIVFADKEEKNRGLQDAENGACGVFDSDEFI